MHDVLEQVELQTRAWTLLDTTLTIFSTLRMFHDKFTLFLPIISISLVVIFSFPRTLGPPSLLPQDCFDSVHMNHPYQRSNVLILCA